VGHPNVVIAQAEAQALEGRGPEGGVVTRRVSRGSKPKRAARRARAATKKERLRKKKQVGSVKASRSAAPAGIAVANGHQGRWRELLDRLINSRRGRIFLCNLIAALDELLVDASHLNDALSGDLAEEKLWDSEDDLMECLRTKLRSFTRKLSRGHTSDGVPDEFSKSGPLLSVMSLTDYQSRYEPTVADTSGHDFPDPAKVQHLPPGWVSTQFREGSRRVFPFWVAPARSFAKQLDHNDAETLRDVLGLVHRGDKVELIAMLFVPPAQQKCYRPTICHAMPNARFMQVHSKQSEDRWGFTVDLAKLDALIHDAASSADANLVGKPELVLEEMYLRDCSYVKFVSLGKTTTDRATHSADQQFSKCVEKNRTSAKLRKDLDKALKNGISR
jgi:hypothetical protein